MHTQIDSAQVQQLGVPFARLSTQRTRPATVAGLCYLAVIAGGLFAEGMVRQSLIVPGDAAATARAILENETLWRLGLAVHLLYLVPAMAVNVIVSGLFRSIEPTLARHAHKLVYSLGEPIPHMPIPHMPRSHMPRSHVPRSHMPRSHITPKGAEIP